ncbi:hypothetical protein BY458DRAFT_548986 [Sporodiniella umbellata]|nr:hypothetical protein BY458DRAFT_548986 [Sporodiniella umbellata]
MLRQLNSLSKITTSSIKYAANNTAAFVGLSQSKEDTLPSPQMTAYWISETQRGLEAFFNDEFDSAQTIFTQHNQESPFHAVGFALMAYIEAILGFESEKIQIALDRIMAAEALAKQLIKRVRRKTWHKTVGSDYNDSDSASILDQNISNKQIRSPEIQYELLATNCMMMASTLQFLKNSWMDYMRAAYKLRKAYKLYDQMFATLTGQRSSEYATHIKKPLRERRPSPFSYQSDTKRFSLSDRPTMRCMDAKRPVSTMNPSHLEESRELIENAIESGIFFGVGLFSLVFSLLPPKINKILNTFGFQSSRPFALHILQKSLKNHGLYSSLSALSLLAYYTNLSLFIHPHLLPNSLSLKKAREILDKMKTHFPSGKIWKLLEGKLCKMEGKTQRGVEILKGARRKESICVDVSTEQLHILTSKKKDRLVCELAQLQALTVYEMGWGQIFLGDYFQASETFFRLEGMNNWSRAFYHYIATCCMFADEEYEKSAMEFMQVPIILKRKRQSGGRLLPSEIFAERKIKHWKSKVDKLYLDGTLLKKAVVINPLWELIYLWNGFPQLDYLMLQSIQKTLENALSKHVDIGTDIGQAYLLLGVCMRELGEYDQAEKYLKESMKTDDSNSEDKWVLSYTYYEMAVLTCFRVKESKDVSLLKEADVWLQQCGKHLTQKNGHLDRAAAESSPSEIDGDSDWDSRLHVRCQLLTEKLDDFRL